MMIFYRTGWVKKVVNDIKLTNFVYISPQWRPAGSLPSELFLVYNKHCADHGQEGGRRSWGQKYIF